MPGFATLDCKGPMKDLLQQLEKLGLPREKFAVGGSGPLGIRGLRESADLDLIVTEDLWNRLSERFPVEESEDCQRIRIGKIEICAKPILNYDADALIREADLIDGIRFVTLERTLEWKRRLAREKDLEDVVLIETYFKTAEKPV